MVQIPSISSVGFMAKEMKPITWNQGGRISKYSRKMGKVVRQSDHLHHHVDGISKLLLCMLK